MKNSKFIKIFACVGLTVLIAGNVALALLPQKTQEEVLTVYSDGEQYAQTTYYRTEESYVSATGNQIESPSSESDSPVNFVMAVEKKVWIVQAEEPSGETAQTPLNKENLQSASPTPLQTTDQHSLTVRLVVTEQDGVYHATGTAAWEKDTFGYVRGAEHYGDDYLALCWGGDATLQCDDHPFSAYAFNGDEIQGSRCVSNSYGGFIWQFRERDNIFRSTVAEHIQASVSIYKGFGEPQGKTTSIKLAYVHTFNRSQTHVSLEHTEEEAFVVRSTEKNNWMVELEVGGIPY